MQIKSIKSVGVVSKTTNFNNVEKTHEVKNPQYISNSIASREASEALKLNSLNFARTIAFTSALKGAFDELNQSVVTCKTEDKHGEKVGSRVNVNKLLHDFAGDFSQPDDALKTTVDLGNHLARTQIKMIGESDIPESANLKFEMISREKPSKDTKIVDRTQDFKQSVALTLTPMNYKGQGTTEQAYVLNTKGNLMAVVEDDENVIMTNAGNIRKIDNTDGVLEIEAKQAGNLYKPFEIDAIDEIDDYKQMPSVGEGTEIIIGMEDGRFVNEILDSIKTFVDKVNNGEIVLRQFVAAPNAKDTQLVMLAGGFGSRAEYTNASSSAIFHDIEGGTSSTKGVFRTPTGLTPMETTFVTLHNAGLLNCSKGVLDCMSDDANIKFYLNKTGINKGNGGYSFDLQDIMNRKDRKQVMIFPNDSMSRLTNAVAEVNKLMATDKVAIAMIAKEIPAKECINQFGIMKLGKDNEILEFAEKPAVIPEGYEKEGQCLTNTFQFAVSNNAFEVLHMFEPFFSQNDNAKETRDWSKQYIPIIKLITQEDDKEVLKEELRKIFKVSKKELEENPYDIDATINEAKELLDGQKIVAVPTSEPWADCGTLNAMYHTIMQVASDAFKLEPFERANVVSCVDTKTGLIATEPKIKEQIENKYEIDGQVMVVPQAKTINEDDIIDIPVVINQVPHK